VLKDTAGSYLSLPAGRAWYAAALADETEAEAEAIFARIRELGGWGEQPIGPMTSGILRGIEDGWFMAEIAEAAFQYQVALEKGDKKVVGVNVHTDAQDHGLEVLRISHEVEREQVRVLSGRRAERDEARVSAALAALVDTARGEGNTIPPMLDAVRAEATLGEICGALRDLWGSYAEPPRF
jgi:methylmalonyl-CoA mutase N-terminal domain/subunit